MRGTFALVLAAASAGCAHPGSSKQLFKISEATEDGVLEPYPDDASIVEADVNSALRIEPSADALREFMPAADPVLLERLRALTAMQASLNDSMAKIAAASERARTVRARAGKATSDDREAFFAAYRASDDVRIAVQEYARRTGQKEALDNLVAKRGGSPALFREWAEQQAAAVKAQLAAKLAAPDEERAGGARRLEITAWIGKPAVQVHVPGYDDLTPGAAHRVEKMVFSPVSPEEMQEAQALGKAVASSASLRAAALRGLDALGSKIRAVGEDGTKKLDALVGALGAPVLGDALASTGKATRDSCGPAVRKAEQLADSIRPTSEPADPAASVNALMESLVPAGTAAMQCGRSLDGLIKGVDQATSGAAAETKAALAKVGDAAQALLEPIAQMFAWGADVEVASAPRLATVAVPLSAARTTTISLLETERAEGDVVKIRARVLESDGRVVAGGEAVRHVAIHARSFVADTGAVVMWVRGMHPKSDLGPFLPSAGAYAVIRFTGWRSSDGTDAGSPFFRFLAPGLGVSAVAIPQASDGTSKLALMSTLQLFGDVLQVGVGTGLDGDPVWGFGVGLHRIAGVGKYLQ